MREACRFPETSGKSRWSRLSQICGAYGGQLCHRIAQIHLPEGTVATVLVDGRGCWGLVRVHNSGHGGAGWWVGVRGDGGPGRQVVQKRSESFTTSSTAAEAEGMRRTRCHLPGLLVGRVSRGGMKCLTTSELCEWSYCQRGYTPCSENIRYRLMRVVILCICLRVSVIQSKDGPRLSASGTMSTCNTYMR